MRKQNRQTKRGKKYVKRKHINIEWRKHIHQFRVAGGLVFSSIIFLHIVVDMAAFESFDTLCLDLYLPLRQGSYRGHAHYSWQH